jgi:hypothetical protein
MITAEGSSAAISNVAAAKAAAVESSSSVKASATTVKSSTAAMAPVLGQSRLRQPTQRDNRNDDPKHSQ